MLNQRLQDELVLQDLTAFLSRKLREIFLTALSQEERNAVENNILPQNDNYEKIINSDLTVKSNEYLGAGVVTSLSGLEISAIKKLLAALKINSNLRKEVINQINVGLDEKELNKDSTFILVNSLQKARLLPVIQYVICDALLTGGVGCAVVRKENAEKQLYVGDPSELVLELNTLFLDMGCKWEDFFNYSYPAIVLRKPILRMAMDSDDPRIVQAVLRITKFDTKIVSEPCYDLYNQTIDQYANENELKQIQDTIGADLRASPLSVNIQTTPLLEPLLNSQANLHDNLHMRLVQCDSSRAKFFIGEQIGCNSQACGAITFASTFGVGCLVDSLFKGTYESLYYRSWKPAAKTVLFAAVGGATAYFAASYGLASTNLSIGSTLSNETGHIIVNTLATTVGSGVSAYASRFLCVLSGHSYHSPNSFFGRRNQQRLIAEEAESPRLEMSPV